MRNDNPDMYQFEYNANTLRIQRNISCFSGNTQGRYNSKCSWEEISDDIDPSRNSNIFDQVNLVT